MPRQVDTGRAFQWAFAKQLSDSLGVPIAPSLSAIAARDSYDYAVDDSYQKRFIHASHLAAEEILLLESNHPAVRGASAITVAPNSGHLAGDPRDVSVLGGDSQLGFSSKSNSASLKHSRLGPNINFVLKWGLDAQGVSNQYLEQVGPVFQVLKQLKQNSDGRALWADFDGKYDLAYSPLLNAFGEELLRVCGSSTSSSQGACKGLFDYVLGNHDFYKVCSRVNAVEIQAFNYQSSLSGESCEYPKYIRVIERHSNNRCSIDVRFADDSVFNFRIHNASKHLETSLKFDIQATKLTPSIYSRRISF